MNHKCYHCKLVIAKEDRRRKPPRLEAGPGALVERFHNQAPRIKCSCGRITILLKGSV